MYKHHSVRKDLSGGWFQIFTFFVRRGSSLSPIRTSTPLLGAKATTAATRVAMPEGRGGELRNA